MRLSIRHILGVLVAGMIIASQAAMIIYVAQSSHKDAIDGQVHAMQTVADTLAKSYKEIAENNLTLAKIMSGQPVLRQALTNGSDPQAVEEARNAIKRFMAAGDEYVTAALFDASGRHVLNIGVGGADIARHDVSDRDYVQSALAGKDWISTTPVHSKTTGQLVLAFSAPVRDEKGKIIGGFSFTHNYENILKDYVDEVKVGLHGYPFILTTRGQVIAHPDRAALLKDYSSYDFAKNIMRQKEGVFSYEFGGKPKMLAFKRIEGTEWFSVATAYTDDLAEGSIRQRNNLLVAGICISVVVLSVVLFALNKLVVRPLNDFVNFAEQVAQGNMKAALTGSYFLECRRLSEHLTAMLGQLKDRLGFSQGVVDGLSAPFAITNAKGEITHISQPLLTLTGRRRENALGVCPDELLGLTAQSPSGYRQVLDRAMPVSGLEFVFDKPGLPKAYLREDASPIRDLDGTLIGVICLFTDLTVIRAGEAELHRARQNQLAQAAKAESVAAQVSSLTQELAAQVEQVQRLAMGQGDRVSESQTAMDQMGASILEVAHNAAQAAKISSQARQKAQAGAESVREVMAAVEEVRKSADGLRSDMQGLGESAASIDNIMTVISDIADQTNLLALNAAIEAARAGDAGRGFAVVADEVRKLAEKTMNATKEVAQVVTGIQHGASVGIRGVDDARHGILQVSSLAGNAGTALSEIVELVTLSADQVNTIATATEEQSAASEQIASGVDQLGQAGQETVNAMIESVAALSGLSEQTLFLERLTGEMRQEEALDTTQASTTLASPALHLLAA